MLAEAFAWIHKEKIGPILSILAKSCLMPWGHPGRYTTLRDVTGAP